MFMATRETRATRVLTLPPLSGMRGVVSENNVLVFWPERGLFVERLYDVPKLSHTDGRAVAHFPRQLE